MSVEVQDGIDIQGTGATWVFTNNHQGLCCSWTVHDAREELHGAKNARLSDTKQSVGENIYF